MPKYRVKLVETVNYWVEVEAENVDAAETAAVEKWCLSATPDEDFSVEGHGVSPMYADEIPKTA